MATIIFFTKKEDVFKASLKEVESVYLDGYLTVPTIDLSIDRRKDIGSRVYDKINEIVKDPNNNDTDLVLYSSFIGNSELNRYLLFAKLASVPMCITDSKGYVYAGYVPNSSLPIESDRELFELGHWVYADILK